MSEGKLIVLEGIDGSGKSTAARYLVGLLQDAGLKAELQAEPSTNRIGSFIRSILKGDLHKPSDLVLGALFAVDRYYHTIVLRQFLEAGFHVVCDRYFFSNIVYNTNSLEERHVLALLHNDFYLAPDLVIYMSISPEIARKRLTLRDTTPQIYENEKLMWEHYNKYVEVFSRRNGMSEKTKLEIIDASLDLDDVKKQLMDCIDTFLQEHTHDNSSSF